MKNVAVLLVVVMMTFGALSLSQAQMHDHSMHNHSMKGHEGMEGMGKQVFKGKKSGIEVTCWLNDVESAMKAMTKDSGIKMDMSKMDPNLTHHISAVINGEVKGAKLKLTYKNATKEYPLMSMKGHFGSDISLKEKGTYKALLIVETEKSGKVEFSFNIKN